MRSTILHKNQITEKSQFTTINLTEAIACEAICVETNKSIGVYTSFKQCATRLLMNPQKAKNISRGIEGVTKHTAKDGRRFYVKLLNKNTNA
jgi:hypothetical protein